MSLPDITIELIFIELDRFRVLIKGPTDRANACTFTLTLLRFLLLITSTNTFLTITPEFYSTCSQ